MEHLWTVVMAGGVGSRFWPVSRAARPKQLLDLFGDGPMLRVTIERTLPLVPIERQVVVTSESLREPVTAALPELPPANLLCEPCGRNTAPAIGWAALEISRRDPDAVLMVLPADQHVVDPDGYRGLAASAAEVAADRDVIVTLGIPPTRPETGYGYIRRGRALEEGLYAVEAFTEKPRSDVALAYIRHGGYDWNAGMFFMTAKRALTELGRYEPELLAQLGAMGDDAAAVYPQLKRISIDYAVMERSDRVVVMPGRFGWSDVGSWRSLWEFRPTEGDRLADREATFAQGDVIELDGGGNVLFADGGLVATVGVRGLVVVHTPDATLVCPREDAQRVREVVARLDAEERQELL